MIYILHGDDITASRQYISSLTTGKKIETLDGRNISISQLEESLQSSLFGGEKTILIENFLSKNKKKKELIEPILRNSTIYDIVFWDDSKLTPTQLSLIKTAEIKLFSLPQFYFQFLDSFSPGNSQYVFGLYHQLLNTTSPELAFYSLLKRVRQLILIQMGEIKNSKEGSSLQNWQIDKLKKQLSKWSKGNLYNVYSQLQTIEIKMKSGSLPLGLSKQLDILILTHLR